MSNIRERAERIEAVMKRRNDLSISDSALHQLTRQADPRGKGVSYQTIRRIGEGAIPRLPIVEVLERALTIEEEQRVSTAA